MAGQREGKFEAVCVESGKTGEPGQCRGPAW